MKCDDAQKTRIAAAGGDLPAEAVRHEAGCARCREFALAERAAGRRVLSEIGPPAELDVAILRHARVRAGQRPSVSRMQVLPFRRVAWLAAAATVLALAWVGGLRLRRDLAPVIVQVAGTPAVWHTNGLSERLVDAAAEIEALAMVHGARSESAVWWSSPASPATDIDETMLNLGAELFLGRESGDLWSNGKDAGNEDI